MNNYHIEQCIFIVGSSRSGTTMISRILGNSKEVFAFNEVHFFGNIVGAGKEFEKISKEKAIVLFATLISAQRDGIFVKRNPIKYLQEASDFFLMIPANDFINMEVYGMFLDFEAKKHQKKIPCEQTPYYLFYFHEIIRHFPRARFINMVRDPRDTLLSQKRRWKRRFLGASFVPFRETARTWINYHPITISRLWNASQISALRNRHESFLTVHFEHLLENPGKIIAQICNFLKIEFTNEMLNVPVIGSSTETDNAISKGVDKTKLNRWKKGGLNNTEIYLCHKISGKFMINNGYPIYDYRPNLFLLIFYYLSFPIKLFFAFILNFKRLKNLKSVLKRKLF